MQDQTWSGSRAVSTGLLAQLAADAEAAGFNQSPDAEAIAELEPDAMHVLRPVRVHDDADPAGAPVRREPHVRCLVLCAVAGETLWAISLLDVAVDQLRALPEVSIDDDLADGPERL